ncbi:SDR family NAD(P)-dependent oxidoreductase [Microbacterium sp. LRZ72]|uniref:SDR family NAD(P)-dependent oxidoreductase n=1 Tax=Microbacterium sp. LRZ72 TaxID=2942481 RepID=UPI0029BEA756|nr:SDR family NAD(P)-dependent oxidoreductase [Microbacterium sp. LRZ72]MDX2377642.1 SDR family NAD(P)-dependent oxidoreductase [Microbacterium sp. LRZ72]
MQRELTGKTAVITGASRGVGLGIAMRLAGAGANVVMLARGQDDLDEAVGAVMVQGGEAIAVAGDAGSPADVARVEAAAVERFGAIDIWVNNVGIGAMGAFWEVPVEDHDRVVQVNLGSLIHGSHTALRRFVQQGEGTLINIGSVDSVVPVAYQATYAATQAAMLSLGAALRQELRLSGAGRGIHVCTVLPWAVKTSWWRQAANHTGRRLTMVMMDEVSTVVDAVMAACASPAPVRAVGWKGRGAVLAHRMFPRLTEHLAADLVRAHLKRQPREARSRGTIH